MVVYLSILIKIIKYSTFSVRICWSSLYCYANTALLFVTSIFYTYSKLSHALFTSLE